MTTTRWTGRAWRPSWSRGTWACLRLPVALEVVSQDVLQGLDLHSGGACDRDDCAGVPTDLRPGRHFEHRPAVGGLDALAQLWLASETMALIIVISVQIWQSTGVVFVLYYAAIGQIEHSVIEAARMDGAGDFRIITSIVWPGVRGTTLAIAILSAIGSLKTFDIPFLITGGGPSYATEFLSTLIYRVSVAFSDVGYGAAISIVLLALAIGAAIIINAGGRRGESNV